jgi:hypothetical protein
MKMLDNFAAREFRNLLTECLERQGWQLPERLANYATRILVEKIDKNPWQPEPSYAEAYLKTKDPIALASLGDTCWFTRAVFPDLGLRRGITSDYYVDLGTYCYARARRHIPNATLEQMEQHFEFIAEIAHTAIWSKGDFRSMWD